MFHAMLIVNICLHINLICLRQLISDILIIQMIFRLTMKVYYLLILAKVER